MIDKAGKISSILHPERVGLQLPEDCSTRCQFWLQFLQLCCRSNNVDLKVTSTNSLHGFFNNFLDIGSMQCGRISILKCLPTVNTVTRDSKSIVESSSSSRSSLGGSVEFWEPSLEFPHPSCRYNELRQDCHMCVCSSLGEGIEEKGSRVKINKFDWKASIHVWLNFFEFRSRSTTKNLDLLLANLLDHALQVILNFSSMSQHSGSILVPFTAKNLVTASSKTIVKTILGSSLDLGIELREVRPVVLASWDIKDDSNRQMCVRHGQS